jgi:hypothetical protein
MQMAAKVSRREDSKMKKCSGDDGRRREEG